MSFFDSCFAPVQPRMRGEHEYVRGTVHTNSGSAPHARGTRSWRALFALVSRFSPACAGNTPLARMVAVYAPVQPRMRGEHRFHCVVYAFHGGSAPHARGTRGSFRPSPGRRRFSPACAGNTLPVSSTCSHQTVQPRMRGEHQDGTRFGVVMSGSAPHARGTHGIAKRFVTRRRFSPACAGNTFRTVRLQRRFAVQPRMRGEHMTGSMGSFVLDGSAPHARGTRFGTFCRELGQRFSPACAGNTL